MKRLACALVVLASGAAPAQTIKVNQIGFLPQAHKQAVVPGAGSFEIVGVDGKPAFTGALGAAGVWAPSGETVRIADFSAFTTAGTWRIKVAGLPLSDPFTVGPSRYRALGDAALKAFYFNRSSMALAPQYAGVWARPAGHPDDKVRVHASAASRARPEGTIFASPGGWYDAGDYNKYIVNSGISTYTLIAALEHFPAYFARDIDIPESGNKVPDILDEAMWNLAWMLTMQDPNDGGVYHKLTNLRFDAIVMPAAAASTPRYVVAKGTAATLDFAATMAAASRVLKQHEATWPGMSARMLAAAKAAWRWAEANPDRVFKNPKDVVTGEYGDATLNDEFAWAAAELFIATGEARYAQAFMRRDTPPGAPNWGNVAALGWMSLAHHRAHLAPGIDRALVERRIDDLAVSLAATWNGSAYRVPMSAKNFVWGSNASLLNGGMMLLQAYRLNGKPDYLHAAQASLDYVLGRNATGYAFVTGFGARPVLHPHHRPSMADDVDAPVPGWLAGGVNPGQQDASECPPYPSKLPALSYLDHDCSYAANEVAINWNAPLVYVTAALSALTPQAMNPTPTSLDALLREEQQLQFTRFDDAAAQELGRLLVERARAAPRPVTIEIRQGDAVLFAHAMPGASPDHADWIRRKNNLVARTGHSSFYTHNEVRQNGGDHDALPGLDKRDYAAHGGAFPIVVNGRGMVGTVTVSGLPGPDDHALAVAGVKDYLGAQR